MYGIIFILPIWGVTRVNSNKKITNFVSEIDQFITAFDKEHPEKSKSQLKEIAKAQRVTRLRDDPEATETTGTLWENF
jgi:hypothetical protein